MAASSCPPADRLRQLIAEPEPAEQADLVAHLDRCADCRRTLEQLAGGEAALDAVRGMRQVDFTQEEPLRRVLDHLEADDLTVLSRTAAHPAPVLSLLRPAQSPGALGRLDVYE